MTSPRSEGGSLKSEPLECEDNAEKFFLQSCRTRFYAELRADYPLFSLQEPFSEDNAPHSDLNVKQVFAPDRPFCGTLLWRLAFLLISMQVLLYDLYHYPPHNLWIYLAYLTHWGHVLSISYFLCSVFLTICLQRRQGAHEVNSYPLRLVHFTWGLYATVAPLEVGITILYWAALSSEFSYVTVMEHGGILCLVLLDGLWVSQIPVRAKQGIFVMIVALLYVAWSVVDYVCDIGNGDWGPVYEDDALYPVLQWNKQPQVAALVSGVVVLVLVPFLFGVVWLLSDWRRNGCSCCCPPRRVRLANANPKEETAFDYQDWNGSFVLV